MAVLPRALRVPLVPLAAALLALAVWTTANLQRRAATRGAERVAVAQSLLTAMLDQETGLRGYLMTGDLDFLEPYTGGHDRYTAAARRIEALVAGDARSEAAEDRADALAARWQRTAHAQVTRVIRGRQNGIDIPAAHTRKSIMDAYRRAHAALVADLEARRTADQRRGAYLSAIIAALVLLVAGGVATSVHRRRRRFEQARDEAERRYAATQTEFADVLSVVPSEQEAHELLQRHLVRTEPGREVSVLADGQAPQCVAMRLARTHEEDGSDDALIQCDLCGKQGASKCSPLMAGGQVVGSVLVRQDRPFDERDRRRLRESVGQAAPVIGNLRAIAMAEERAATDALTGLPNRRAADDTLKRMVAQAGRTVTPLAALAIDLDHFKQINDRSGHEKGDDVLVAVAAVLAATVRGSDFTGRIGGEEFLVLAPDTGSDGGLVLAEKLRAAISRLKVRGLDVPITASIGVAALPEDATDAGELLRRADRALYAAKERGRDRVERAGQASLIPSSRS